MELNNSASFLDSPDRNLTKEKGKPENETINLSFGQKLIHKRSQEVDVSDPSHHLA